MTLTTRQAAAAARRSAMVERGAVDSTQRSNFRCAEKPLEVGLARIHGSSATMRATLEKRGGEDRYHLYGHASVTDKPYEMWDFFGPYEEIIEGKAFDHTLMSDPDVAYLVNHKGVTMARHKPGLADDEQTLLLAMDEIGLMTNAWVNPKRNDVKDLVHAIDDGDVDQMSFAFMIVEGWWSDDFETYKISEVDIDRGDVSAVNYGANPFTDVAARARQILDDVEHLPVGAAGEALRRLWKRPDLLARSDVGVIAEEDLRMFRDMWGEPNRAVPEVREKPVERVASRKRDGGRSISTIEALLNNED